MKIDQKQFTFDLSKPSLEGLAQELRKGVDDWDFRNCNKCAMGLARRLWWPATRTCIFLEDMRAMFNISRDDAYAIFQQGYLTSHISPSTIADRIENYLASRKNQLTSP